MKYTGAILRSVERPLKVVGLPGTEMLDEGIPRSTILFLSFSYHLPPDRQNRCVAYYSGLLHHISPKSCSSTSITLTV